MKFKIDIECTPQEARTFLGLPDVESVQKAMLEEVEARLRAGLERMDPESLFRTWMPAIKGWEDLVRSMMPSLERPAAKREGHRR